MTTASKYATLIPLSREQLILYSWRPCPPGMPSPGWDDVLADAVAGVVHEATAPRRPDLAMVEAVARRHLGGAA